MAHGRTADSLDWARNQQLCRTLCRVRDRLRPQLSKLLVGAFAWNRRDATDKDSTALAGCISVSRVKVQRRATSSVHQTRTERQVARRVGFRLLDVVRTR